MNDIVNGKILIRGLTGQELISLCGEMGEPAFRARQIWRWLYVRRITSWDMMTNVPAACRRQLADRAVLESATEVTTQGGGGSSAKMLIRLLDGNCVETVIIPAGERKTVCISSQVGCRFGCVFCASGKAGFGRNLSAGEMVEQVLQSAALEGGKPTHAVFMGIGEPFDNYDEVLKAARIINDADGLRLGARRITISTCGHIPGIMRLSEENLQLELSVSLHAPSDELRSRLMPVNRRYPLASLMHACSAYTEKTKRIVTFEYTLIAGVNDSSEHAAALAQMLRPLACRVNLIPLSPIDEYDGKQSAPAVCRMFMSTLRASGLNVTLRNSAGGNLKAACGQLRANRAAEAHPAGIEAAS